jgi:hypothetical protein
MQKTAKSWDCPRQACDKPEVKMNGHFPRHATSLACTAILVLCTTGALAQPAAETAVGDDQASKTALPPLESIAAESDIRCFLAPGVPAELTRAALRHAWVADPAIRDFVGLSENAWDFDRRSTDRLGSEHQISRWDFHGESGTR